MLGPIDIVQPSESVVLQNYSTSQNWRWNVTPGTRVFDVRLNINIREFFTGNPTMNGPRTIQWVIRERLVASEGETRVVLNFNNELFWQFLGANLEPIVGVRRVIEDLDLIVTGVGEEIEGQLELEAANSGITSAQTVPTFSNVTNGLGVFTGRTSAQQTGNHL